MSERPKLLLVDDEASVRKTLELVLEDDFDVLSLEDAETAAVELMSGEFALLILDKNLPGKSGLALARLARERNPTVKIMMITGYASTESAVEALSLGLDAYLEKPFDDVYEIARKVRATMETPVRDVEGAAEVTEVIVALRDPVERARVVTTLEGEHRTIREASTLEEVGGMVRAHGTGLLILGAELADRDLIDVVRELREIAPGLRCVVAAEQPPLVWIKAFIELGVHGLLERPFDEISVRSLMEVALAEEETATTEVA